MESMKMLDQVLARRKPLKPRGSLNPQGRILESTKNEEKLNFIESKILFSFYRLQAYSKEELDQIHNTCIASYQSQ